MPSLDLITASVEMERARQAGHAESLDSKAGALVGFAGVVVALRGLGRASWLSMAGLLLTVAAALLSAWTRVSQGRSGLTTTDVLIQVELQVRRQ